MPKQSEIQKRKPLKNLSLGPEFKRWASKMHQGVADESLTTMIKHSNYVERFQAFLCARMLIGENRF